MFLVEHPYSQQLSFSFQWWIRDSFGSNPSESFEKQLRRSLQSDAGMGFDRIESPFLYIAAGAGKQDHS